MMFYRRRTSAPIRASRPYEAEVRLSALRNSLRRQQGSITLYALITLSSLVLLGWSIYAHWLINYSVMCGGFVFMSAFSFASAIQKKREVKEELETITRVLNSVRANT